MDFYGAPKKIRNMIKQLKKSINEYVNTKKVTSEEWENHFHALYGNIILSQTSERNKKIGMVREKT